MRKKTPSAPPAHVWPLRDRYSLAPGPRADHTVLTPAEVLLAEQVTAILTHIYKVHGPPADDAQVITDANGVIADLRLARRKPSRVG